MDERRSCTSVNRNFSDQSGSTLIEVMISAVLMLVISTSVYGALEATSRAGAQERHRARAYALAQDDQARVRSLKTSQLSALSETNTVVEDGITYTVTSTGTPTLDRTADSTCESGNTSADYVAISSKVTWTSIGSRPPVVVDSIIAPPNGTLDPDRGALAISILDSRSNPYAGIQVNGTGTSTFSGTTNSAGCVIFGNLPQGNYTVTPSVSNLVDADGNPPGRDLDQRRRSEQQHARPPVRPPRDRERDLQDEGRKRLCHVLYRLDHRLQHGHGRPEDQWDGGRHDRQQLLGVVAVPLHVSVHDLCGHLLVVTIRRAARP